MLHLSRAAKRNWRRSYQFAKNAGSLWNQLTDSLKQGGFRQQGAGAAAATAACGKAASAAAAQEGLEAPPPPPLQQQV